MDDTKNEAIKYHENFDLDTWVSQAGIQEDETEREMGWWEVNDTERLYVVSPNIKRALPIVESYMKQNLNDWILIGESVREVSERGGAGELGSVTVFAAYKSTPKLSNYLVDIKYFGIVSNDGFYLDGYSREIDGLNVLGLDHAVPLQPLSIVVAENEIEGLIGNAVKALEYKNLRAMLIEGQQRALDKSMSGWDSFEDNNHKSMMISAIKLQNHLTKTCFDDKQFQHDFAYDVGPILFAISVCPELYFYQTKADRWLQTVPHSPWDVESLTEGQMMDLKDTEGLYLIGKPSKDAKDAIIKRLAENRLPPYNHNPCDANNYTYDLIKAIVVQPKNGVDGTAGLPVYLYAVEECNNRYRGENKADAEALNWRSVWIYAEQVDGDGKVLLSGDDAFASIDINSDYLRFGYCSENSDYEPAKEMVKRQLEADCIRSVVSRTQAMRVRLAAPSSVYGDKPILVKDRACTEKREAVVDRRFDIIEMSAKQIDEYKCYSAALKKCTDNKTKSYEICTGFIVIDNTPWDFNNLTEYSVITQVFMPTVDENGDEARDEYFLMERYDCSANECAPQLLSAGLADNEPELQLSISYWLCGEDGYCPSEISLTDNTPILTLSGLRWMLDNFEEEYGHEVDESARIERQLKVRDLDDHFLEVQARLRDR